MLVISVTFKAEALGSKRFLFTELTIEKTQNTIAPVLIVSLSRIVPYCAAIYFIVAKARATTPDVLC